MGVPFERVTASVEGDLDLRGTLGTSPDAPVGFERVRVGFDISAPEATADQLTELHDKAEQYCVVLQTLTSPPPIETTWGA